MSRYQWENDESDAEYRYGDDQQYFDAALNPPHPRRSSARRQALFHKAVKTLAVAAKLAGEHYAAIGVGAWHDRNGQRIGLYVILPDDKEMSWTPRGGYNVAEIVYGEIPF